MSDEIWKELIHNGVKDEYLISSYANIYDKVNNKYVEQKLANNGYYYVSLRTNNTVKCRFFLVHRLVAENFIIGYRLDQNQVNHINGNKKYNVMYNLEWCTAKENMKHAYLTGLSNNYGENNYLSKLTNVQVERICELLSNGAKYKDILIDIGLEITPNNLDMIGNIYRGISWKNISSKYIFPDNIHQFKSNDKEIVESICYYISIGLDNKGVYEKAFGKILNTTRDDKNNYELIRRIRQKKLFKEISDKYF